MRRIASTFAFLALCIHSAFAADPLTKHLGDSRYSLTLGPTSITIDAGAGAKVLSFTSDGREVISQLQRFNAFGSTFWTSPQKEWNWPPVAEFDRLPYEVEDHGTSLTMTSRTSERLGYRIRKHFAADATDGAIVVTYSIINESADVRQVAPWEITRVPADGLIFFDADASAISPAGTLDFKNQYGAAWYAVDEAPANRKVNADAKGWLAYAANGLLLVKKFADLEPSEPAPDEAEVQVYVNQGRSFIELESQGAYATLQPGASLSYAVRWYLLPLADTPAAPSELLLRKVKTVVE